VSFLQINQHFQGKKARELSGKRRKLISHQFFLSNLLLFFVVNAPLIGFLKSLTLKEQL
jgi:hypothetical protein